MFDSGHFMIILFGYFLGCSYVKQVMQNMNIEGGEVCDSYIESLSPNNCKSRRESLQRSLNIKEESCFSHIELKANKVNSQRAGITYSSGIASKLGELQDEVCIIIKNITIGDAETSPRDASLPVTHAPPQLTRKRSPPDSTIIYFDLERSSRAKDCKIVQLAVVSTGNHAS